MSALRTGRTDDASRRARRLDRFAVLADAAAGLAAALDERTIVNEVAVLTVPDLAARAEIFVVRPDERIEHFTVERSEGVAEITRSMDLRALDEIPAIARDAILADGGWIVSGAPSSIAAPLAANDRNLGALVLTDDPDSAYDDDDLQLVEDIARIAAISIENARTIQDSRRTESRYRSLVQTLDAIAWEATPDPFRFTFVSDYAETLLGYGVERWLADPEFWASIVHPEDRDWATAHAERSRREATDHEFEYRVIASDGRVVWLRERVRVEPDANGRAATLRGLMIDITERKMETVYERAQSSVDRVFASTPTLAAVPEELLRALCEALEWDVGALWGFDERAGVLRCTEIWHSPAVSIPEFERVTREIEMPPGLGLPGRVLETGAPAWIDDVSVESNFPRAPYAAGEGLHSALGFPVGAGGKTIGVIEFLSREIRPRDDDMLQMMATIGGQTGQFLLRRLAEESALFERAMLESQNEATIDGIVVTGTGGRLVSFNTRFSEMWGLPSNPSQEDIERQVFGLHADSEEARKTFIYLHLHPEEKSRSEIALRDGRIFDRYSAPLRASDGTILGRAYYYRDITDRKRTEAALADNSERLQFLAEASEVLSASLDYTVTLDNLARISVPYLADWCVIDVLEPAGTTTRVALYHSDPQKLAVAREIERRRAEPAQLPGDRGPLKVLRTGESDLAYDISEDWLEKAAGTDRKYLDELKQIGFTSYMCVPLIARGEILGVITFLSAESQRHYGEADLALAEDLARRAGLAVDNARLYSERSWVARTLQESLLPPHLPEIPGMEVGAIYYPAGRGLDVGGDFYDMFDTGRGEWAVLIGDVCGKGADAAALTALSRYTVRAAAMQARAPKRVLSVLNEAILRQRGDGRFCTVAFLRVYPERNDVRRITVGCGGHPLPLVLRADGSIETAGAPGSLLGVLPGAHVEEYSLTLGAGDTIVLYTDGVIEARGPEGEFGESGLRDALAKLKGQSAQQIASSIAGAAVGFQPGIRDDIAVVALRVPSTSA